MSQNHSKRIAYLDETGFDAEGFNPYCYAPRGQVVWGERSGHRRPRTNLIAARYQGQIVAPMLIEGSVNADVFEGWLEQYLLPILEPSSLLILDNAAFHRQGAIRRLAESAGHQVLFLPPYSPDYNKIEHDFAAIKKLRAFSPASTSLDEVICRYSPCAS